MVNRLFRMVYLLMDKPQVTAKELAEKLEVTERTIYRDLDRLSLAGIPVYTNRGKNGGISLLPDYVLDRAVLTADEKTKVMEALWALKELGVGDENAVLDKLQSFFGSKAQDWIEISFSAWGDEAQAEKLFYQLKTAILQCRYAEIEYSDSRQKTTRRRIKPLKLCFKNQAWYLYAFCEWRKDYRFFKLKRISDIIALPDSFEREEVGRVLDDSYARENAGKQPVKVTLKVNKELAFRAYDEMPVVEKCENGDLHCAISVTDMEWFIGYVLSYGEYIEVIKPRSVRELLKKKAREIVNIYGND